MFDQASWHELQICKFCTIIHKRIEKKNYSQIVPSARRPLYDNEN